MGNLFLVSVLTVDSAESTIFEDYIEHEDLFSTGLNFKNALVGSPSENSFTPALKYSVSQEVLQNAQLNTSSVNEPLKM